MEKSVPSAKKKFSIRDIMTIAAMMVICFIIMMVMSSLTLPFPLVYLYGSAGIDGSSAQSFSWWLLTASISMVFFLPGRVSTA